MWPKGETDLGDRVMDLGEGVTAHTTVDAAGEWVGLVRRHPRKGGEGSCASAVAFDTPTSRKAHGDDGKIAFHTVLSWDLHCVRAPRPRPRRQVGAESMTQPRETRSR
jgi:hypothetical protein